MFDGKEYYKNNRIKILKRIKKYQNNERVRKMRRETSRIADKIRNEGKKQYVKNYKLSKGCSVCGYKKCVGALEFHHNGDKEFGIALLAGGNYALDKTKKEMEKCIILCSNCHRELHSNQNKFDKDNIV